MTNEPKQTRYRAYPEYKPSGVEWLGDIPAGWEAKKLKFIATAMPSNIDKKSKAGEPIVRLCNYTDVYYSELIEADAKFMKASATPEQITKFTLRAGDTIITKDSEDPSDIAVPSYVPEDIIGVVCGYHLSMIRPINSKVGKYIKRCFECGFARSYFAVNANGLTRYGLGAYPLNNVVYPVPPEAEQIQIAAFLDYETAKIDALIAKQQRLIALLEEKRQAVISHAVTKGLNPNAPLRPSGIDWLGDIPAHWEVKPLKHLLKFVTSGSRGWAEFYSDEGSLFFRIANLTRKTIEPKLDSIQYVTPPHGSEGERSRIKLDDLLISITADLGSICVADHQIEGGYVSQHVALCRPIDVVRSSHWLGYCILSDSCKSQLLESGYGGTKIQLSLADIRELWVAHPPCGEQAEIAEYLESLMGRFADLISLAEQQVTLLKERRAALISAAVTGKIDVRDWTPPEAKPAAKDDAA